MTTRAPDIGRQIRELRKLKGLSQDQLAEAAEIDAKSLSRIERGVFLPALDTVQRLADALGLSIAELFAGEARNARALRHFLLDVALSTPDDELPRVVDAVSKALKVRS